MDLSNNLYDRFKLLVLVVLPGLATLYVGLAQLWDLPNPEAVAGSIALFATFLGIFVNRAAALYGGAGDLVLTKDPQDGEVYLSADLNQHPSAFGNKKNVTLNVRHLDAP